MPGNMTGQKFFLSDEEAALSPEEASSVTTCVRIVKKMLEEGNYEFTNADQFHNLVISSLYKLTDGQEGFKVVNNIDLGKKN